MLWHILFPGATEICVGAVLMLKPNLFVRPENSSSEPTLWLWRRPSPEAALRDARDGARVVGLLLVFNGLWDISQY
jgi:hypothetical protein